MMHLLLLHEHSKITVAYVPCLLLLQILFAFAACACQGLHFKDLLEHISRIPGSCLLAARALSQFASMQLTLS